jgi:hypothetical protein
VAIEVVTLPLGRYRFYCLSTDSAPTTDPLGGALLDGCELRIRDIVTNKIRNLSWSTGLLHWEEAPWTTLTYHYLPIINNFTTVVVGEVLCGGIYYDPARFTIPELGCILNVEAQGFINNAVGVSAKVHLYDGTGTEITQLSWAVGNTSRQVLIDSVAASGHADMYYATAEVIGGDGLVDALHLDSLGITLNYA